MIRKSRKNTLVFLAIALAFTLVPTPTWAANPAADFRAGRIIDNEVFTNKDAMNPQQIQAFLNSKVPICDNGGTRSSELGGGTRAQYGAAHGNPIPFTCLKEYWQNPTTGQDNYGGKAIPAGGRPAAQLIWDYAQQFTINPQVLIVTLQKENGMVTDEWPFAKQYREAMGFGCPDNTAPGAPACDPSYGSFSAQIYQAARHFRGYMDNKPGWFVPYTPGTRYIAWSPTSSCGGANVNIENSATAALYSYTPYQPNRASLNAGYGTGDGCSSYGNRNFWNYFTDWFGRTTLDCSSSEVPYAEVMRSYNPQNYKHFYTAYVCEVNAMGRAGFAHEGTAFYQTNGASPYAVVVHRLYNPSTQLHLWATTQQEINAATQLGGYRYEGVAFYAVKPEVPGHVPVHRLYNPQTYQHIWLTTQGEINSAMQFSGYRYEGVAFYAAPPPR